MSLFAVFLASLLGSPHCAGMCGGFTAFCAGSSKRSLPVTIAYNGGRLLTYLMLGALAGALGRSLDDVAALVGIQRVSGLVLGVLMVLWGVRGLVRDRLPQQGYSDSGIRRRLAHAWRSLVSRLNARSPVTRALFVGLGSTLLPCGWLYTYVTVAAASGSPLGGMLTMAVFWLGTVPMLTLLGIMLSSASFSSSRYIPRLTSTILLVFGVVSLLGHFELLPFSMHAGMPDSCTMHHGHH